MDKLIKITQTPVVFIKIANDGCETIYASAKCAMLHYESGKIKKSEPHYEKYYRKVDESFENENNVTNIVTYHPDDPTVFQRHYFQEIPVELSLAEKQLQESPRTS